METIHTDTVCAIILGHAIADALGVPVEFCDRESLTEAPVTDYRGFGSHNVPAGTWSDDTSMTLATLDSLSHGLHYTDLMERFCAWMEKAAYTATGTVFDMGISTSDALFRYRHGAPALMSGGTEEYDNGNGSLMRILPAALYCKAKYGSIDNDKAIAVIHNISSLTHAHLRSRIGCGIYAMILDSLLECPRKASVADGLARARAYYSQKPRYAPELVHYLRIWDPGFQNLPVSEIRSGGYVVYTLEAAIWCLMNTDSYREAVCKAVNLGADTDTTAAVTGGLAGALYGLAGIPEEWIQGLRNAEEIFGLCHRFSQMCLNPEKNSIS